MVGFSPIEKFNFPHHPPHPSIPHFPRDTFISSQLRAQCCHSEARNHAVKKYGRTFYFWRGTFIPLSRDEVPHVSISERSFSKIGRPGKKTSFEICRCQELIYGPVLYCVVQWNSDQEMDLWATPYQNWVLILSDIDLITYVVWLFIIVKALHCIHDRRIAYIW